jgi:hypothetical protein
MSVRATFSVYGDHIDDLKEKAYAQGESFFRCVPEDIRITDLSARPIVQDSEGVVSRWRGDVTMEVDDDDLG